MAEDGKSTFLHALAHTFGHFVRQYIYGIN